MHTTTRGEAFAYLMAAFSIGYIVGTIIWRVT